MFKKVVYFVPRPRNHETELICFSEKIQMASSAIETERLYLLSKQPQCLFTVSMLSFPEAIQTASIIQITGSNFLLHASPGRALPIPLASSSKLKKLSAREKENTNHGSLGKCRLSFIIISRKIIACSFRYTRLPSKGVNINKKWDSSVLIIFSSAINDQEKIWFIKKLVRKFFVVMKYIFKHDQ